MMSETIEYSTVLDSLRATSSYNNAERIAAEALIKKWETEVEPGFLSSLLRIAIENGTIPEVSCSTGFRASIELTVL